MLARTLSLIQNGKIEKVEINIYSPIKIAEDEYSCKFSIIGGGFDVKRSTIGIDSLQSALLSLSIVKDIILSSKNCDDVFWLEKGNDIDISL
ncbi:DUF6968 family protein [Bosea psychrotolerans]|uniref:DUF6968 family protein n=1 Tax=Bosea psychrotolerans TaxID=1871628 RepID=UPI0011AFEA18|nr:hypothetical protein [Bosea psychrotolerans]